MINQLTSGQFIRNLSESGLLSQAEIDSFLQSQPDVLKLDGNGIAQRLIAAEKLTSFQAEAVRDRRFAELVIGNYQVLDRLGAGGMGTVYKARHRRMKRIVAIKVLSRDVSKDEKFIKRFQREVEAVARLNHPNVVMAYDADRAEVGDFLVMEFVNGQDLDSEVMDRGPLPIPEAVDYIIQAARALDYAHREGIIHRDIKPANLLRDVNGVVKVADLGLARISETLGRPVEQMSALTQAGAVMGTVDFMPPEQAMGLANIDRRADIYSLGCTLYYLLTRRAMYHGPSLMAILFMHREAPIPSLRAARAEIPAGLDQVYQRMVAKDPNDRFDSMADVIHALETVNLSTLPTPAPPESRGVPQAAAPAVTMDFVPRVQGLGAPAAISPIGDKAPISTPNLATTTILLVEPSRSQAVIIRTFLQKLGHPDISTAASGQKALEVACGTPPKVVLCAMHLSDMTGVQLAQKMQAEKSLSSTGFVLITSQSDAEVIDLGSQTGNIFRLHKPFDMDGLSRALAEAAAKPLRAAAAEAPSAGGNLRVLVVDDSAAARSHIRRVLTDLGLAQISEAADGAEALTLLGRSAFDLVVTDYNMPYLDGRALVDFIRHRSATPAVPIVVVTTETDAGKLEAIRRLGVAAICDKSFKPEVVRGILSNLTLGTRQ